MLAWSEMQPTSMFSRSEHQKSFSSDGVCLAISPASHMQIRPHCSFASKHCTCIALPLMDHRRGMSLLPLAVNGGY